MYGRMHYTISQPCHPPAHNRQDSLGSPGCLLRPGCLGSRALAATCQKSSAESGTEGQQASPPSSKRAGTSFDQAGKLKTNQ